MIIWTKIRLVNEIYLITLILTCGHNHKYLGTIKVLVVDSPDVHAHPKILGSVLTYFLLLLVNFSYVRKCIIVLQQLILWLIFVLCIIILLLFIIGHNFYYCRHKMQLLNKSMANVMVDLFALCFLSSFFVSTDIEQTITHTCIHILYKIYIIMIYKKESLYDMWCYYVVLNKWRFFRLFSLSIIRCRLSDPETSLLL